MNTINFQTAIRLVSARAAHILMAVLFAAVFLGGSAVRAADTAESWIPAATGSSAPANSYTNFGSWSPAINTPGGITNWPANLNGNGVVYDVILTNGITTPDSSDVCLYTNTDINGTNVIGVLAIGGYNTKGVGGGSVSNAFIMTGGMLTLSNTAADVLMIGGDSLNSNSVADTNYFIITGGTLNSTNTTGGNNWLGAEPNTYNYLDLNGGTVNLDGLFMGGYGNGVMTINGSTVNFWNQTGGGTPGAIAFGWEPGNAFTVNVMSGTLNITNKSPSINFHANTGSGGFFTLNVSGGTLNASELELGGTAGGNFIATNAINISGGAINLESGGIIGPNTAHNTNLIIMSGGTFSTLFGQSWTLSSSANPIINILTNTPGNGTVTFAPLANTAITLSGIISGPGTLNAAGPGRTVLNAAMGFTGGLTVTGGTLAINAAQTQSLGLSISSGGNLQINNVNNALVDNPISVPAGGSITFSNTTPILFGNTVNGGGNLIVQGGSSVTNSGNLQNTGVTYVNVGDLVLVGSGAISGPLISVASGATLDASQLSSFNLGSGQTLTGNGTVVGPSSGNINFNSGSTLAPSYSSTNYTLTLDGSLVFNAGSTNYVTVNKGFTNPNSEVVGLTSATLGGTIFIANTGLSAFAAGDAFQLFSAGTYNTNGFNIVPATPGSGLAWAITNGTLYVVGAINPNAPAITNEPVSAAVNPGVVFANTVGVSGAQPFYYQWYQYPSDAPIAGATNASLILNPVVPADATNYYVEVTNVDGTAFSTVVSLSVNSTPVISNELPITYTNLFLLYAGADPTFSVSASSVQPTSVFYQWFTNGVGVAGATNASFTLTNAPAGYLTNMCVVTNGTGVATNAVWTALVLPDPTNGLGGPAPYPQAVLALNPIAYWRLNEPESGGGDGGVIAHDYAGGNDGIYTNVILGQTGYNPLTDPSDSSAEVGSSSFPANGYAGQIGTNIDFAVPAGSNAEFSIECWVLSTDDTGGGIAGKGWGNGGEEAYLDFGVSTTHAFRFFVRSAAGTSYPANSTIVPANNQWYHVVGVCDEANSNVLLYVNGALAASDTIPSLSGVLTDSVVNMTIGARSSSQGNGTANPPILDLPTIGNINDVAVFDYALSSTQIANEFNEATGVPIITKQPVGTYVGQGSNATVSATVVGSPPLSYQWYETNLTAMTGFAVAGQTNSALVISNIQASANYYLYASNPYGSTNSAVATVSVYSSPLITAQFPITCNTFLNTNYLTVYAGANPTFSVGALGFGTLYYQWFTNGAGVGGATGASFTWTNVQTGTNTIYCIVTNYLSPAATSTVWLASIIADPTNSSGGLAAYPLSVLALNPIGYWRLNEPDDGNFDGNPGAIAHDYASGNDGIYTNVYLGNVDGGAGYNPVEDPSDSSAQFGYYAVNNSDANYIGTNIDFSTPAGSNAEFSVECWVDITTHSTCGFITKGYGSGGEEFSLDCDNGTTIKFFVRGASGTSYTANSAFEPTLNTWYHMVGVCDEANSNVSFYVDGQLNTNATIPANSGILSDIGYNMIIGARPSSLANAQAGNQNNQTIGYMNDVAVFNHALTAGQIANQYDSGGGTITPYFAPTPPASASAAATTTLTIPVTAIGTPPMSYWWTNVTTSAAIATGSTNTSAALNASLNYANVPLSWNGDQLELTVSNAYGMTNTFVTLSIANAINPNPTNIVFSVTDNQLSLSWPADHTGWQLQAQTNSLSKGISTNWVNVSNSTTTNKDIVPVNLTNGCVFYRLTY